MELKWEDPKKVELYKCSLCNRAYVELSNAQSCCKPSLCEECGKNTPKHILLCNDCMQKRDVARAEKLTLSEYNKLYPEYPLIIGDDYYFDEELLLDEYYDEPEKPKYAWGAQKTDVQLSLDYPTEILEECMVEELSFPEEAFKAYYDFASEWNRKCATCYYSQSKKIIIELPDEFWDS